MRAAVLCFATASAMFKRAQDTKAFESSKIGPTKVVLGLSTTYAVGYLLFCRSIIFGSALPP